MKSRSAAGPDTQHRRTALSDLDLHEAALGYIARGLRVIALTGKTPNVKMHRRGIYNALDATSDPADIDVAFLHPDTTGVGILTTWPLVVVDIDGPDGAQAWKELVGPENFIPDRWVARTGRGLHLYMGSIEPTGSMKLAPLLDLKGEGGYVAAPPSRHPDGGRYEWLLPPDDMGPTLGVPDNLEKMIRDHNFDQTRRVGRSQMQRRVRHPALTDDGILYAAWGFDSLIEGMDNAAAGNRNNYLHWAAATMAEEGASDEEFEELRTKALKAGLTRLEVTRTIRSARRAHD